MEMTLAGFRFMVVDDDPELHALLEDFLRLWGCEEIQIATNGREGVDRYQGFRPHVVLMDMEMPEMNGYEASRAIVEQDAKASIILLTGLPDGRYSRRALEQGFARVIIPKPFRSDQLRMAIHEALRGKARSVPVREKEGAVA
jgi:CheY-like chemotaxis protein